MFLSSCHRDLRAPNEFQKGTRLVLSHGTPLSSQVVKGLSGLLSSSGGELGLFLEVQQGSQTSLHVVRGSLMFHSRWCRRMRPFLELRGTRYHFDLRHEPRVPLEFQ